MEEEVNTRQHSFLTCDDDPRRLWRAKGQLCAWFCADPSFITISLLGGIVQLMEHELDRLVKRLLETNPSGWMALNHYAQTILNPTTKEKVRVTLNIDYDVAGQGYRVYLTSDNRYYCSQFITNEVIESCQRKT